MDPMIRSLNEDLPSLLGEPFHTKAVAAYVLRHIRDEIETAASQLLIHSLDDALTYIDKRIEGLEK